MTGETPASYSIHTRELRGGPVLEVYFRHQGKQVAALLRRERTTCQRPWRPLDPPLESTLLAPNHTVDSRMTLI